MDERTALVTLAHIVEPADVSVAAMVQVDGPVDAVARIRAGTTGFRHGPALQARLERAEVDTALRRAERMGLVVVDRTHELWPRQLDDLHALAPYALWVRGRQPFPAAFDHSIAVVGARQCTPYGESVSRRWCTEFVAAGFAVVSGGAFGIDAAAHRGTLSADGLTVCVLACGVDVVYPSAHDRLLLEIAERGLVVSESPLGASVQRQRFLSRNRLIAAFARATVVVEAAMRSGTTSTAGAAASLNRPVLAVPGPVTSPASAGCHRLVADAVATIALSAHDVLSMAGHIGTRLPQAPARRAIDDLTPAQMRVLDAIPAQGSAGLDDLVLACGLAWPDVAAGLAVLQREGFVVPSPEGWGLPGRV